MCSLVMSVCSLDMFTNTLNDSIITVKNGVCIYHTKWCDK